MNWVTLAATERADSPSMISVATSNDLEALTMNIKGKRETSRQPHLKAVKAVQRTSSVGRQFPVLQEPLSSRKDCTRLMHHGAVQLVQIF